MQFVGGQLRSVSLTFLLVVLSGTAIAQATPAAHLSDYVGTYANAYYGPAKVTEQNGSLVLKRHVRSKRESR